MYTKLLILIIPALLTACGSSKSTIKDDWPGINELSFSNQHGQETLSAKPGEFNFNSYLSLPKMGVDVSYTLITECTRNLSFNSEKKKVFSKEIKYNSGDNSTTNPVPVIDHLPEEALIFPETFKFCDFRITAINQNGSTDSSELKEQKINLDDENRKISIYVERAIPNQIKGVFSLAYLNKLTIETLGDRLSATQLICYSNKINTESIKNSNSPSFSGTKIIFPQASPNFPIEYCIIKGQNHLGESVISDRFKILNKPHPVAPFVQHSDSNFNTQTEIQYPYASSNFLKKMVMRLKFYNSTTDIQYYNFNASEGVDKAYAVTGLTQESRSFTQNYWINKTYSMNLKEVDAYYGWRIPSQDQTIKSFSLKPEEEITLELIVYSEPTCLNKSNNSKHFEIGYIVAPKKDSPFLQVSLISKNDFITEPYLSGSLFETHLNLNMYSNLPSGHKHQVSDYSTAFQLFYRNKNSHKGEDLVLSSRIAQTQYDNKGEPLVIEGNTYPFSSAVHDDSSCTSNADFYHTGVDADGTTVLQPLGSRSVDL